MTGAERLCRLLEERGITCVFAVPGSQTVTLHEALRRSRIRVVLATHELAACFMANGYYRASGVVAPVVTIPGPGFTYALTGLAEALHDSAAVLHIAGAPASADHRQHFQALDQRAIALPLVKAALRVERSEEMAGVVGRALDCAYEGEPGPVLLEWTQAALNGSVPSAVQPERRESAALNKEPIEQAAAWLGNARRPVLLTGQGCASSAVDVLALAEHLGAPVLSTTSGRGIVPEDHRLALGFDFARSTADAINEFLAQSDCVVVLGAKLSPGLGVPMDAARVLRVDTDRARVSSAALGVAAPVHEFVQAVLPRLERVGGAHSGGWPPEDLERWRSRLRTGNEEPEPVLNAVSRVAVDVFFEQLRAAIPRDAIVVTDAGLHQMMLRRHFDVLAPRGLIVPSDFQSMGFGMPAAIGARLGSPGRSVLALVGDGGFAMSGMELLTAVRENVALTVVVFADGALNHIRLSQLQRWGAATDVALLNPDFHQFANAVGARYTKYRGLASDLAQALEDGGVSLMEVPLADSGAFQAARAGGLVRGFVRRTTGTSRASLRQHAKRLSEIFIR
jgi:acetolactate synthase-1/2/3 large subunit